MRKLQTSEIIRSIFTLSSGTALAQALPVLISPILTRLYSPEEFATFGLFAALIGIVGIVATGRYDFAIMLPEHRRDAYAVGALALLLSTITGVVVLGITIVFHDPIIKLLNAPNFSPWLYLVPVGVFLTGIYQVFNLLSNRQKAYIDIAKGRVVRSLFTSFFNLFAGVLKGFGKWLHAFGLIGGLLLGQIVEVVLLGRRRLEFKRLLSRMRRLDDLKKIANRYQNFPKFDVPSELMVTASVQLPVLLFNRFFTTAVVGYYFHAHRVLSIPMTMIGSSVGQVLMKHLSVYRNDMKAFSALVAKAYRTLLILAAIPYSIIVFFGPELFGIVFGSEWAQAGRYAQLLAPWLLFNFVGSPLTMVFSVLERQKAMFGWITAMFILRATALFLGIVILGGVDNTVLLFSLSGMVFYFSLNFYIVCILSHVRVVHFVRDTFGLPLAVFALVGILFLFIGSG